MILITEHANEYGTRIEKIYFFEDLNVVLKSNQTYSSFCGETDVISTFGGTETGRDEAAKRYEKKKQELREALQ